MDSGVYILQSDNKLIRMNETPYEAEVLLQRLLQQHPDLLAGDQIDRSAPRRWIHICDEAGVPSEEDGADSWSLDHLFLDQDAVPTFVEVKRSTDTRIRREVVAQMLDYAANATQYWPVEKMREWFNLNSQRLGQDPAQRLEEAFELDDVENYWSRAHTNLREGRVRLLFVADKIPASLQRIVEFLNRQMNPAEVLAVEVRQFTSESDRTLKTLVPRVMGQTEEIRKAKAPATVTTRRAVSMDEFYASIPDEKRPVMEQVLAIALEEGLHLSHPRTYENTCAITITLPGVSGKPATLESSRLWITLGRYHPSVRTEPINKDLRAAILKLDPTAKQAANPAKSEVGLIVAGLQQDRLHHAHEVFKLLKAGLES